MSWWNEDGAPPAGGGEDTGGTKDGPPAADLTGKPAWMPDSFWVAPEEGGTADFAKMAEKMAGALKESRQKITTQGEQLARFTVPDGTAPYFEGLDKATLVKANERSGYDEAALDGMMARLHSAGVGPGAAQAFVQNELKARHEATPVAKSLAELMESAVAEGNAQGRPASEMLRRIQAHVKDKVDRGQWTEKQAEAWARSLTDFDGIEAAHSLLVSAPAGPAEGKGITSSAKTIVEAINKKIDDPRYGVDPTFTNQVKAEQVEHAALIAQFYAADRDRSMAA